MRVLNLTIVMWLLAAMSGMPVHAQTFPVATSVAEVEVYRSGATVVRRGKLDVPVGQHVLRVAGLPADIQPQALQIAVQGRQVEMGQVRTEVQQRSAAFDTQVADLMRQIDAQKLQIKGVEDSTATAALKLKFLEGIAQGYAKESWFEGARGAADISSWRAALDVLQEGSDAARRVVRNNGVALREHQAELSRLERELQSLRGKSPRALLAEVAVNAGQAQTLSLQLTYRQYNAGWRPKYEARVNTADKQVRVLQKAQVFQGTEENWERVKLTLASSQPSAEIVPPEVGSLMLDLQDPLAKRRSLSLMRSELEEVGGAGAMVSAPADQAEMETTVDVSNYGVTYEIPGQVSIANDQTDQQFFDLNHFDAQLALTSRIFPSFSATAFLTGQFTYMAQAPLSANEMAVYLDNTFVGQSYMPGALPGAEIRLPLGQDRRLEVRYENLAGSKGEGGVISRRAEELTSRLFEITNRRDESARVEVVDRYPVARHEDIEVDIPRGATPPAETDVDDREGVILWRKDLAAGETWRIEHQYEVSYPAKMILSENQ